MATTGVSKVLTKKGLGVGGVFSIGMNAYSAASEYKQKRTEGHSKLGAAASAAGDAIMFDAIGFPRMLALGAVKAVPNLAVNSVLKANSMARSMDRASRNVPFANATFTDSQQAYTMRQAGMQLAQASKYNLQQSLMGNEASVMHRL